MVNRIWRLWRKNVKPVWDNNQLLIIMVVWFSVFVLGFLGICIQLKQQGKSWTLTEIIYRDMQLFVMDDAVSVKPGDQLNKLFGVIRVMAPFLTIYTVLIALAAVFHEKLKRFYIRWFVANHVVICGLGRKGLLLTKGFCEQGFQVIVIEKDKDNSSIEQSKDFGAMILMGNATAKEILKKAQVKRARYIFAVCGDGANTEIAVHAYSMVENLDDRVLACFVHIVDPQLCSIMKERGILTEKNDSFRLEFFNIFESGARILLDQYPAFIENCNGLESHPHILVVGLGQFGKSIVIQAARRWWLLYPEAKVRLRITIIDNEAEQKVGVLCLQCPQLEHISEITPLQIDIHSLEFQRGDFLLDSQKHLAITMAYICLDDNSLALSACLRLFHRMGEQKIPIVVRMQHSAGLATILRGVETGGDSFDNLHAFGLLDNTCTPDLLLLSGIHESLARSIHEKYVQQQSKLGVTVRENPNTVPWSELPENIKESNLKQVDHIGIKLKAVNCKIVPLIGWDPQPFQFSQDEIEFLSEMEHSRWVDERKKDGWIHAPGQKNPDKKTHPSIVPWEKLPESEKEKDRETIRNMPEYLSSVGFDINRQK